MCTSKPKPPQVIVRDPVADAAKAAADSQNKSNQEIAARRKRLRDSNLFTIGQRGVSGSAAYSAYAASEGVSRSNTLGGG